MRSLECFNQALLVIDIGGDDFGSGIRKRFRLRGIGISRYRAHGEGAFLVLQDCIHEATALSTGRANYRNDLLVSPIGLLFSLLNSHSVPPFE
jgi:hypothetical protein